MQIQIAISLQKEHVVEDIQFLVLLLMQKFWKRDLKISHKDPASNVTFDIQGNKSLTLECGVAFVIVAKINMCLADWFPSL